MLLRGVPIYESLREHTLRREQAIQAATRKHHGSAG